MTCYSTCNFVQTFSLSHLNRVLSCEVDHNLAGHTTRHTPILVIVAVQKLQNQLKRIARITKKKFAVSIDHDLLICSQYVSYVVFFTTPMDRISPRKTELLLKVALKTIILTLNTIYIAALSYNI